MGKFATLVRQFFPVKNAMLSAFHMGTHVAYIWYFVWFAPDHPYGRHMCKPYGFYVGTIRYTHVVYHCETHMGKPYVCHMSDVWLTHVTPIWVVGCKPHEIPHLYHIVFLYWSHMDSIRRWSYVVCCTLLCSWHGNNTVHVHYRHLVFKSNQIIYCRQLHVQHFLTSYCKVKQRTFYCTDVTVFQS